MTNINKEIIKKIKYVIEHKYENIFLKDLKKYFSSNTNLKKLGTDIRYIGIEQFENDEDYLGNLKVLLKLIIEDKNAVLKDVYENKNYIKSYKQFKLK